MRKTLNTFACVALLLAVAAMVPAGVLGQVVASPQPVAEEGAASPTAPATGTLAPPTAAPTMGTLTAVPQPAVAPAVSRPSWGARLLRAFLPTAPAPVVSAPTAGVPNYEPAEAGTWQPVLVPPPVASPAPPTSVTPYPPPPPTVPYPSTMTPFDPYATAPAGEPGPVMMSSPVLRAAPARRVTLDVAAVLVTGGEDATVAAAEGKTIRLAEVAERLLGSFGESEGPPDVPAVLKELGVLEHAGLAYGVRLETIEGVETKVQSGDRVAQVTGAALGGGRPGGPEQPGGRTTLVRQVRQQDLGVRLAAEPCARPDGVIAVRLSFEASMFGPEEEGTPVVTSGDETVRTPVVHTLSVETAVAGRDGQGLVAYQGVRKDGPKTRLLLILVKPQAEPRS